MNRTWREGKMGRLTSHGPIVVLVLFLLLTIACMSTPIQAAEGVVINTVEDLQNISLDLDGDYILGSDIDLSGLEWTPLGRTGAPFTGSLNGNEHSINGLNIESSGSYKGLFASIQGAVIENIAFSNANVIGQDYIGILAGRIKDDTQIINLTIANSNVYGTGEYVGAVAGYMDSVKMSSITTTATVAGEKNVGGLTGYLGKSTLLGAIVDVTVSTATDSPLGALASEGYYSNISNIQLNSILNGFDEVGGLFGKASFIQVQIIDCMVDIDGDDFIGGVIGTLNVGLLKNVNISGEISGHDKVGGLIGQALKQGEISEVSYKGEICGNDVVGGLLGYADEYNIQKGFTIVNYIVSGKITGGLVGFMSESNNPMTIKNSFALGEVLESSGEYFGGLAGYLEGGQTIENSYAAISARNGELSAGLVGYGNGIMVTSSYYDGTMENVNPENRYDNSRHTQEMLLKNNYEGWDFDVLWELDEYFSYPYFKSDVSASDEAHSAPMILLNQGQGTIEEPYLISTTQEFDQIRYNLGAHYKLINALDFSGMEFRPIGSEEAPFTGSLDGNEYKISNLAINSVDSFAGLFANIKGVNIKNLYLLNISIEGTDYVGCVSGISSDSTFENIRINNEASVRGNDFVGMIVGRAIDTNFKYIEAKGPIFGNQSVGGLVGSARASSFMLSSFNGNLTGNDNQVGGLVGFGADITIENCFSTGVVVGSNSTGGLVGIFGYQGPSNIDTSYSAVEIYGLTSAGPIVGSKYEGELSSTYYDNTLVGSQSIYGIGKSKDEMNLAETFLDWDFIDTWTFMEGLDYPRFYRLETPMNFRVENLDTTEIAITWDFVEGATGYEVEVDRTQVISLDGNTNQYLHDGLVSGTRHTYRVKAINSKHKSFYSEALVEATLLEVPEVTVDFIAGSGINIAYPAIFNATKYSIEINGVIYENIGINFQISDYHPHTYYSVRVKAINEVSDSKWSEQISMMTHDSQNPYVYLELINQPGFDSDDDYQVSINGINLEGVYTVQYEISYDPTVLDLTEDSDTDQFIQNISDSYMYQVIVEEAGTIKVICTLLGNQSGSIGDKLFGTLFFDEQLRQISNLSLVKFEYVDSLGNIQEVNLGNDTLNLWYLDER